MTLACGGNRCIVFYPGSFDPVTNGHMDVIKKSMCIADKIIVAIGIKASGSPLFTTEERVDMIQDNVKNIIGENTGKVGVISFEGLVVDAMRTHSATVIVRGLRDVTDFNYEMRMASMNAAMSHDVQTVFFPASPSVGYVSSSIVRQVASMGGDVSPFVSANVANRILAKYTHVTAN